MKHMTYDRAMSALAEAVMDKRFSPKQIKGMGNAIKKRFNVEIIDLSAYLPKWTQEVTTGGFNAVDHGLGDYNTASQELSRALRSLEGA